MSKDDPPPKWSASRVGLGIKDAFKVIAGPITPSSDRQDEEEPSRAEPCSPTCSHTVTNTQQDVMLSYSHKDTALMEEMRDLLTNEGYNVWVDTKIQGGANFFTNIGEAIIGCDVFLFLLTPHSVQSKFCQDEVSLARISDKKIMPVTYSGVSDVLEVMDAGLRLVLSSVQWVCLKEGEETENHRLILDNLGLMFTDCDTEDSRELRRLESYGVNFSMDDVVKRRLSLASSQAKYRGGFWDRNFGNQQEVLLEEILSYIKQDYEFDYKNIFVKDSWVLSTLEKWCFDLQPARSTIVTKIQYKEFLFPNGNEDHMLEYPDMFWVRCKDGFSIRLSMNEVFNETSSVRFGSIQNLAKIKSKRVLNALYKLVRSPDPNIRAIACISLANSGDSSEKTLGRITELLGDGDRLVRQSACLSLARLKSPSSVPHLLLVWRNDFISDVRSAALRALEEINTEEAEEGRKVFLILEEEIKQLA